MNPTDTENWEDLANAVVWQAAEDYRFLCRALRRRPWRKDLQSERAALERFFTSRWFRTLSALDGKELMEQIGKENAQ